MLIHENFYFIRHGQTDWNVAQKSMGQQDIPLNNSGIIQARNAAKKLKNLEIKTICVSPLSRAKNTAFIINEILQCPIIEIENLQECCWGIYEGSYKDNGDRNDRWLKGETPVGAESFIDFFERVMQGMNEALKYPSPLIVSHGGVYLAILKGLGYSFNPLSRVENCVPIYHEKPNSHNELWKLLPVEKEYDYEPFDL